MLGFMTISSPFMVGLYNFTHWCLFHNQIASFVTMWSFASNAIGGSIGLKNDSPKLGRDGPDCSDDEASSNNSEEEGLECPICWESFNIVENVPYVLWCGHTLCKNCVLGLQWAVVKFPTLPIQLPLFISCPWCYLLSFRLVYKGNLMFPRKNFFLLWMVERMNGDRVKAHSAVCGDHVPDWSSNRNLAPGGQVNHSNLRRAPLVHHQEQLGPDHNHVRFIAHNLSMETLHATLCKFLVFFVHLTAKFPLVIIFLLILLYAIPASAAILALYILITVLFAIPSFLILYFAYPSLDWLVREIIDWDAVDSLVLWIEQLQHCYFFPFESKWWCNSMTSRFSRLTSLSFFNSKAHHPVMLPFFVKNQFRSP